jgi:hypothetical protein
MAVAEDDAPQTGEVDAEPVRVGGHTVGRHTGVEQQ